MQKTTETTWQELYNACTASEREEIVNLMQSLSERRQQETLTLCKSNTKHLSALPISKLREIANLVSLEAHLYILSACPEKRDLLHALEGLTVFNLTKEEPTAWDIQDAIDYIKTVWAEETAMQTTTKAKGKAL